MPAVLSQALNSYQSPNSQLIPAARVLGIFYNCLGQGQLASHLGKAKHVGVLGHV